MHSKKLFALLLLFVITNNCLKSQTKDLISDLTSKDSLDKRYGLDPSLYNGVLYQSSYPRNVKGDQYFSNPTYIKGEAIIRGVVYKDIDLNLDIYKQELLLKYLNSSNGFNVITISKAWLEAFTIGPYRFVIYSTPEVPKGIYQVLGSNTNQIYYFWKKYLSIDNVAGVINFTIQKEQYVLMNNSLRKYRSNRTFLQLFSPDKQVQIKKYLQQNKINVNKASDKTMEELINYCSK